MDDIFSYLDYREYLRDHYNYNKSCHGYFSFRYVAGKTGLDASFYVKVLNKQKHIANTAISTLIQFLKLNKKEGVYFTTLVYFNKAKTADQESLYLQKLLLLRKSSATLIENDLYEYFAAWWNVAIREELNILNFTDNYDDLASRIHPAISVQQARRSIKLLLKLGLIKPNDENILKPTHEFLTTNGLDNAKAVRAYQKMVLKLASSAIDLVPRDDRDISTLTISTSRNCLEAIRERLSEVRREIMEIIRQDQNTEEVFQINIQIFPLTRNSSRQQ
jgi:uncharacterized protein (TIGR02147 family)